MLAALVLLTPLAPARAEGFRLLASDRGYWRPADPLRIELPADLPPAQLARLAVELDGIDITALLQLEGGVLVFRSPEPLRPGPHRLRLVAYREGGELVEIAAFPFEVRASALFREFDLGLRAGAELARELAASPSAARDPPTVASGALEPAATLAKGSWRAVGQARLDFTSREDVGNRRVALTSYVLGFQRGRAELLLGHATPLEDGLLVRGFASRGVVARWRTDAGGPAAVVFAMRSDTPAGFEDITGLAHGGRRIVGGALSWRPPAAGEALGLRFLGYRGRGPGGGAGVAGGAVRSEASGLGLELGGRLLAGRFDWRLELARSWWDADGPGGLVGREADEAIRLTTTLRGSEGEGDDGWRWQLGAEASRVGPLFTNLLGSTAARGLRTLALAGQAERGSVRLALELRHERELVGSGAALPEHRRERAQLGLGWSPETPWVLGLEEAAFTASLTRTRPARRPAGASVTDTRTLTAALELSGQLLETEWSLELEGARITDLDPGDGDELEARLALEMERALLDDRLTLNPRLALGWAHDEASRSDSLEQELELGISLAPLWGERHALDLTLSWVRSRDDFGPDETITRALEANLTLELLEAQGSRPGLALRIQGALEETRDDVTGDEEDSFRLGAVLAASWELGRPRGR